MTLLGFVPHKRLILAKILFLNKKFIFDREAYSYFLHPYNASFANERAIEVSIAKKIVENNKNKNILEIGNVLSHYTSINHTVVDKYEKATGVINEDALTFKPKKRFDLIISVSTFEHIGLDEEDKDPKKILKVIRHLKTLLNKKGEIFFTVPIGYNKNLDKQIKLSQLPLTKSFFLKRQSMQNTWKETSKTEALKQKYNTPYPNANAIMVGIVNNS